MSNAQKIINRTIEILEARKKYLEDLIKQDPFTYDYNPSNDVRLDEVNRMIQSLKD